MQILKSLITRNSAIADKPRDTFRDQAKVTKHGIISYVRLWFPISMLY